MEPLVKIEVEGEIYSIVEIKEEREDIEPIGCFSNE
jgi:hypothetical protein